MSALVTGLLLLQTAWTTSVAELQALPAGSVTLLDARSWWDYYVRGHIPAAVRISWWRYRAGWFRTGKLPADLDGLAADLAQLGVDERRPVVVYGKARDGWGEEGRIAWMLHYLGHRNTTILDGGWSAWVQNGGRISRKRPRSVAGRFRAQPVRGVRAFAADVMRAPSSGGVILDVRSSEEWNGATPFFERRAGRIPGAVHLEWRKLLDPAGRIDRSEQARARLRSLSLTPERPVIVYCVAGVRSGEAFVALKALGFRDVRNYDGSWYEWSGDERYPIVPAQ